MKLTENIFWQGVILTLTTQVALSIVAGSESSNSKSSSSQGIVGALYRSAAIKATPEKEAGLAQTSRGQRCVRCESAGYNGNGGYQDRYYGDYYYRDRNAYYGREDPYYGRNNNWYYQPEYRNSGYDRNYNNRYADSRYYGREEPYNNYREAYYRDSTYNDPRYNDARYTDPRYNDPRYVNNDSSYRGNGYDNLNPTQYEAMRERFQRDRGLGYDDRQYYDRSGYGISGGYYDNRNFRPYDETYRGTSGFDNSGRGYFFANRRGEGPDNQRHHPNRDPYDQAQKPFANHYNPQSHQNPPKTQITPEFYNGKPSQTTQTISSGTIGTIDSNPMKNNSDSNKEIENKDQNSAPYGRPSLGSSYLFERKDEVTVGGSDAMMSQMSDGNSDSKNAVDNMDAKSK